MSFGTELASLGVGQARVHCNNCDTDLTALIHITCSVCTDFDLCVQCFSSGAELGSHKKHHAFTVLDNCTFPVLADDWGADEELLLLEAVEQHGLGNWHEIADAVGSKTANEVKTHFESINLGAFGSHFIPGDFHNSFMEDRGGAATSNPNLQSPPQPLEIPPEDAKLLGYWPKRDDFERDYAPDAETLVSYLDVAFSDEGLEKAAKLDHVHMYNQKLLEREHYKRIAKEHHLFPGQPPPPAKKKKHKREERDLKTIVPLITRLTTPKEYEHLLDSLAKERLMQGQVKDFMRYRSLGITSLTGCAQFEARSLQREVKKTKGPAADAKPAGAEATAEDTPAPPPARPKPTTSRKLRAVIHLSKTTHLKRAREGGTDKLTRGAAYLSSNEAKLCSGLGMTPSEYLTAKAIVLKDKAVRKHGDKAKVRHLSHLSPQHTRTLIMFFKGHGWL